jgi:hypothetical protein
VPREDAVTAGRSRRARGRCWPHLASALAFLVLTCAGNAAYAQCAKDTDCKGGRVCIEGRCSTPTPCQQDADCTGGLSCQNGLCLPGAAAPPPAPEPPPPPPEPQPPPPEPPPAPEPPPPPPPEPALPPVYQPPVPDPTITASGPFKRKRSWSLTAGGAAGFFAKNLGSSSVPALSIYTPTKVVGVETSLAFVLTQQKRLALQLGFELSVLFDPNRDHGNYLAAPMAMDLGLRFELGTSVAMDLRLGGGGVVSTFEDLSGVKKTKMHPIGVLGLNFFFIDLLHVGLDAWFGKANSLVAIKFGFGF